MHTETKNTTLAGVIETVRNWSDLAPQRKSDLLSALNAVVKASGQPPDNTPADPEILRAKFLQKNAAALRVSPGRFYNIRSALAHVMTKLGLIDDEDAPASPAWDTLLQPLGPKRRLPFGRFARFCTRLGVEPSAVADQHVSQFLDFLTKRSLTPQPRKMVSSLTGQWNKLAREGSDWPTQRLSGLRDQNQYTLPLERFTAEFQQAVTDLGKRLAGLGAGQLFSDDPLDDEDDDEETPLPQFRPLRASTVENRQAHVRWAASALVAAGVPIEQIRGLPDLVQPLSHAQKILRFLYSRAGNIPSTTSLHVGAVLTRIAKFEARLAPKELRKLQKWCKQGNVEYKGMTDKNIKTIEAITIPDRRFAMVTTPEALIAMARKSLAISPSRATSVAMRAVAIEFLLKLPIRLQNLINLRLDQHLHRADPKGGRITYLLIPAHETKNRNPIRMPVAESTAALLDEWINDFRPIWARGANPYLFPSPERDNSHVTPQGMRQAIKSATGQNVGESVTPHQFRHFAAKLITDAPGGHYGHACQILSHSSPTTTKRAYLGFENDATVKTFDGIIEDTRNGKPDAHRGKTIPRKRKPKSSASKKSTASTTSQPNGRGIQQGD